MPEKGQEQRPPEEPKKATKSRSRGFLMVISPRIIQEFHLKFRRIPAKFEDEPAKFEDEPAKSEDDPAKFEDEPANMTAGISNMSPRSQP